MKRYKKYIRPILTGILTGIVVTAILFMGLPLLTEFSASLEKEQKSGYILVSTTQPPPPPKPEEEKKEIKKPEKKKITKTKTQKLTAIPKIDVPNFNIPGVNLSGGIKISNISQKFDIDASPFATAFNLTEVDQKPYAIRKPEPIYPFLAKRKNIEGMVWIKCVIDKDGYPLVPEVYKAEPEGIFEENALEAIARWKFQPAIVDGEPVDCIVYQPITFGIR